MLKLDTWTYSEAITHAAGWQNLAMLWGSRISDTAFQTRRNLSSEFCNRQMELAAHEACVWYARARRKSNKQA